MSLERIDPIRRVRRLEPARTPSWMPPLPPKPRESTRAEPREDEDDHAGHVDTTV
jgi:hypothetical protein